MKELSNKEIKEVIQSGHINILIGSGCSQPYLNTLSDIEKKMNDEKTREQAQKEYYKIIKKSKAVLDESLENNKEQKADLTATKLCYDSFCKIWTDTLSRRSLHIVNKQINLFSTNFDMFIENSCERLNIPYNDGFSGQINRIFDASNYNKILKYKSLQFDNTSDIPLVNIIKLHGSISWEIKSDQIIYSDGTHILDDLELKTGKNFEEEYSRIAVVNPHAEKHFETVLDTNYAAMLRKFTLELEKENSVLFIYGCSLDDKHIKHLLYGVLKSNPTLIVIYYSYEKYDESHDRLKEQESTNLYIISKKGYFEFKKQIEHLYKIFLNNGVENEPDIK
jgi:hypothetical protein